ncbi:MAG: addiction module toxin, HicA family [Actinobacteria bacterium]|nr:addiction module toxin, HicA family [Actinomycetota bacterium]
MVARTHPFSSGSNTTWSSMWAGYYAGRRCVGDNTDNMTSLRELEIHLVKHGFERVRHGVRHDVWRSSEAVRPVTVPRHREIPWGTARAICRQLLVPDPPR